MTRVSFDMGADDMLSSSRWQETRERKKQAHSYERLVSQPAAAATWTLILTVPFGAFGAVMIAGWNADLSTPQYLILCLGTAFMGIGAAGLIAFGWRVYLDRQYHREQWDVKDVTQQQGTTREAPPVIAAPSYTVRMGNEVHSIERPDEFAFQHAGRTYRFNASQVTAMRDAARKRGGRLAQATLNISDYATYTEIMTAMCGAGLAENNGTDGKASYYLARDGYKWLHLPPPPAGPGAEHHSTPGE